TVHDQRGYIEFLEVLGNRLLNKRKFETVVVDLRLGERAKEVLQKVRLSPSNHTTVAFAITEDTNESAQAFDAGSNFVLERPLSPTSVGRTLKVAYGLIFRERLRYFRCPASIPTAVRDDTKEIDCQALNISEGGMAITTPVSLKPGTQVHVKFTIPDREIEITAESEVCWSDEKGRAGLRFITTSPEQVPELRGWLSRMLEKTLPESVAMKFRPTALRAPG
ncbi:MAG TPA: PilZ domain-containing protein, partial [Terriglobales bacterium]|nr:PilZ domain-containing protein [Terriglobales bacterium]